MASKIVNLFRLALKFLRLLVKTLLSLFVILAPDNKIDRYTVCCYDVYSL